jgi:hypothetical protein
MKVLTLSAMAAVGLLVFQVQANAGGAFHHHGHHHGRHVSPSYYHGHHHSGYRGGLWNRSYYHDTSHYDYVPPRIIPHGNHIHVQPGGYYWHQTGHVHHGNHIHY